MTRLTLWPRGFGLRAAAREDVALYVWFYEWTLWDAIRPGPHSRGAWDHPWQLSPAGDRAAMSSPPFSLEAATVADGADLRLTVANETDYAWPEVAGIIPCLNPGGPLEGEPEIPVSEPLLDEAHAHTYFVGERGLDRLEAREIHFNHDLRARIDDLADDGAFVFSDKWPTSDKDAYAGLIIREAPEAGWVGGIAWERYLSAQGHNPWRCMHLSVHLGPLAPGETRTVRGKVYLFEGTKDDCLSHYRADFA